MGFKAEYYVRADSEIKKRKAEYALELSRRHREIAERIPEYAKIKAELEQTASKLTRCITNRNSDGEIRRVMGEMRERNNMLRRQQEDLLKSKKYKADYLDVKYYCAKCKDTGVFNNTHCVCFMETLKKIASKEINKNSGVVLKHFDDFSLEYYSDKEYAMGKVTVKQYMTSVYNECKRYADDFHLPCDGIFMYGTAGLGKTHLSLSIVDKVLGRGYSAAYGSAPDLFRKIEEEHFGHEHNNNTLESLRTTDLLVIDDLGSEFTSSFYTSALYNILNSRMNNGLPTIISSNFDFEKIKSVYDERIYSRIQTMTHLKFYGKDIRFVSKMKG